jgi:hypothetical protein
MSLFENQIKTLITTLETIPSPESFDIGSWYDSTTKLDCGYAACICGHQALAPTSEFFNYEPYIRDVTIDIAFGIDAGTISELLDASCLELTQSEDLSMSIYSSNFGDRKDYAYNSEVFTRLEREHPFLNKHEPTSEEAISYLRLVLTKLGGFSD